MLVAKRAKSIKTLDGIDERHEQDNSLKRKLHAREIEFQKESDRERRFRNHYSEKTQDFE